MRARQHKQSTSTLGPLYSTEGEHGAPALRKTWRKGESFSAGWGSLEIEGKMSTMVTVAALSAEVKGGGHPQLIDVRTASEYASGHIPCTVNVPMDQFEARRKDLRLEAGVVLVCKAGSRAQIVAGWLGEKASVRVLEGGTDAWTRNGLEVVTTSKSRWSLERQVRLGAGLMVLAGTAMAGAGVHWGIWLAMLAGAGLTFAGATDICMMGIVLAKMPWNQARVVENPKASNRCCG
jgi:rhodanese-related sulfurtransferase